MSIRVVFATVAFFAVAACDSQAQVEEMQYKIRMMDSDWSGTTDLGEWNSTPYDEGPCPGSNIDGCNFNTFDSRDSNPWDGEIQYEHVPPG